MTNHPPEARVSRLSFITDMTKVGALEIPLGFMLEATWPKQARWLGLIGRTRLTPTEIAAVNLLTWPELEKPFDLLGRAFDRGWEGGWGEAWSVAQGLWSRSPVVVRTTDHDEWLLDATINTENAWTLTTEMLSNRLSLLGQRLIPPKPVPGTPHPRIPRSRVRPIPLHVLPRERRMREEFAQAA